MDRLARPSKQTRIKADQTLSCTGRQRSQKAMHASGAAAEADARIVRAAVPERDGRSLRDAMRLQRFKKEHKGGFRMLKWYGLCATTCLHLSKGHLRLCNCASAEQAHQRHRTNAISRQHGCKEEVAATSLCLPVPEVHRQPTQHLER